MTLTTRSMLAFTLVSLACAPEVRAGQFNINTQDSDRASCSSLSVSSDEYQIASAEEAVPAGAGSLHVTAPQNGGIWITGSDAATPSVRACKFVAAPSFDAAQSALGAIRIQSDGNRIAATGPRDARWMVYFVVQAPRGGDVTAKSINGPISVRGFDGTLVAHASNGPIAIKNSRGTITGETVNGPLSVAASAGDVRLTAQNGPLAVVLDGNEWDGAGLQGQTNNGPLSLRLPTDYRSGVVVESEDRAPVSCRGCANARDTRDDRGRRIEFGSASERVHLKTNNGPVSVRQSTDRN